MKYLLIIGLFNFVSCTDFFSSRAKIKKFTTTVEKKTEWDAMYAVFETKCLACHANFGNSEEEFLANGLAVPKKPEESNIIKRLINNTYNDDRANMPKGGVEWTDKDLKVFVDWVKSIKTEIPTIVVKADDKIILGKIPYDLGFYFKDTGLRGKREFSVTNNSNSFLEIDAISMKSGTTFFTTQISKSDLEIGESGTFTISYETIKDDLQVDTILISTNQGVREVNISVSPSNILSSVGIKCNSPLNRKVYDYVKPLRKNQYINHLRNILDPKKLTNYAESILGDINVSTYFDLYPNISRSDYQEKNDGGLINEHVKVMTQISMKIGEVISNSEAHFTSLKTVVGGACSGISNISSINSACLETVSKHFGRYAYSRNLNSTEFQKIKGIYDVYLGDNDGKTALNAAITSVLLYPEAWMMIDPGSTSTGSNEFKRSKSGLIRILSFTLTDSSPDSFIIDEAESKDIFQEANFNILVDHLKTINDADGVSMYTMKTLDLVEKHLGLSENYGYGMSDPMVNGVLPYYQSIGVNTANTFLGTHALDNKVSDQALLKFLINDQEGSVDTLLESKYKYSLNDIQKYINKTSEVSAVPQISNVSKGTGIFLNNAIFAGAGSSFYRSPPRTASRVLEKFGCVHIGEPEEAMGIEPGDLDPPQYNPQQSIADTFNDATSQNASCRTCHDIMNPFSSVLQEINAIGDKTSTERHFNSNGDQIASHSLKTDHIVNLHGQSFYVEGVDDLAEVFRKSGSLGLCISKKIVEMTYQSKNIDQLGCEIQNTFEKLMQRKPIKESLVDVVRNPIFKNVKFDPIK